ncbi:MAG: glycosyltransferase family 2 protein [Chloroflexi bacterium]|nr:glycosyltransferase family 2 protein [Chloroflexota bacterium]
MLDTKNKPTPITLDEEGEFAVKVSLVIPAYNEAEGVMQTADAVRSVVAYLRKKYDVEVVFVNDGSKDNTAELLQAEFADDPTVRVVSHERNRGLGAAIRTGFQHATGDVIITTDFDGTYPFSTIPQLLSKLIVERVDIVTASPYHPQGHVEGVPRYRLLFSFGASLLYRILVSWRLHTWTALYRAYRRHVVESVSFESDDFLAGTELLVKACRAGYTVSEFPTTLHVRTFGQSSIRIARVTMSHLKFQTRLLKSTLFGSRKLESVPAVKGNS